MHSLNETNRKNLTGSVSRFALAAVAAIGMMAPAPMLAQAPGAVFTNNDFLFPSDSSGTNANFGVSIGRISANQRGDIFLINQSSAPNLIMNPAGTQTQIVIMSNLGSNSSSVATDVQGNLWVMNGSYGAPVFIPVTAGVYPSALDATKITASCKLPVATSNTSPCNVPLNYGSTIEFAALSDIQLDAAGNLYALDFNDNQVSYGTKYRALKFDAATLTATAEVDIATSANQSGRMAISTNGDIFEVDGTNVYYSAVGSGTFTTLSGFSQPTGISSDSGGNIYVTETAGAGGIGCITVLPNVAGTVNPADRYIIVYATATNPDNTGAPHDSASIDGFGALSWGGGGYSGDVWRSPPASLSFGPEAIGSYAGSQTLPVKFEKATTFGSSKIVSNSGTAVPFAVTTNTCTAGTAFAAAAICNVSVNYVATAVGPQAGTLFAYDNANHLLGTVYLSGSGLAPLLNVDPGTASAIGSGWNDPSAVTVDATGNTYVADSGTGDIYKNGSSTPLVTGFNHPSSIVVDTDGNLYVAENGSVVEVPFNGSAYGNPITVFTGTSGPAGLAIDASSNLYLADSGNARVLFLSAADGLTVGSNPSPIEGSFTQPVAVAADSTGNVYISDSGTGVISQYNFTRGTVVPIATGLTTAAGVAVDPGGNLYFADAGKQTITRVPNVGGTLDPSSSSALGTIVATPSSIAVDGAGNVYAADSADATVGTLNRTNGAIDFGSVVEGHSSPILPATISNGGNAALTLGTPYDATAGANPADFALQSSSTTCVDGAALAVGGSCSIGLAFTPSIFGPEGATLTLASNGGTGSLSLAGGGTEVIDVTITGPATVVYGNKANFAVTATEDGTYVVNISGSAVASTSVVVTGGTGSFTTPVLGVGTYTIGLAATIGTTSFTVTPATLTLTAGSATRAYGTPNPVFTSTIAGEVNGDTFVGSGTTTATEFSNAGTYSIVPEASGSASKNYTFVDTDGVLTITQVNSNTAIAYTSSNNGFLGGNVTFTATVLSLTSGVPTGTVTFEDVTNVDTPIVLGTGTLDSSGKATFSTSTLKAGTIYVEAVYSGDVNFITSSSAPDGVAISLPSFLLSSTPQTLQIVQGQSGAVTISVTPVANFSSPVVFSCAGLPLEASCSFASPSATPTGSAPATDVLTIQTVGPASSATMLRHDAPWNAFRATVLALMIGSFAGFRKKRFAKGICLFVFVGLLCLLPMTGCGLQEKPFVTPLGIYNVTITGACAANNTLLTTNVRLAVYTTSTPAN